MSVSKHVLNRLRLLIMAAILVSLAMPMLTTPARAADPVSLTMWTWKQSHLPALQELAKQYETKTGTKVTISVFNPDDAYRTKVQTAAQSGDLADVLAYWSGNMDGTWDLASNGLLTELTSDVDAQTAKSFLAGTLEKNSTWTAKKVADCKANKDCKGTTLTAGQIFSLPFTAGSFYIVYTNRSLLKQAGLDPDIVPKDTNEFLDVMEKVYKATGKGATIGGKFQDILRNWIVNGLAISNCGPKKYADMINGAPEVSLTDKCALDSYQFIGDMTARKVWQPGFQQLTIDQADIAFAKGDAAFDFGGSFTLGFVLQQGMKAEDVHTFTLPALPTSQEKPINLAPFGLIDVAVTQSSKHQKEAKDFIFWLTKPDQMAVFAKMSGDMPATKITDDPSVVGAVMSGLVKSYANSDKALQASPDWSPQASPDAWGVVDEATNKQVTGEGNLLDNLKAADDALRADRAKRGG